MSELAIEVSDLGKTISVGFWGTKRELVRDVSFTIRRGSLAGFVGHNGAGKSTTIKALIGAIRPTRGVVRVLDGDPTSRATRRRLGYLPELPRLPESLTPRELMRLHTTLAGVEAGAATDRLLDRVGLLDRADDRVGGFSKGMQQRMGLALALIGDPELLILDEPMTGLDPAGRRLVREVLVEEGERGATVFFSSHILPDVEAMCDHIVVLHRGEVVSEGPLDDVLARHATGTEILFRFAGDQSALASVKDAGEIVVRGDRHALLLGPEADALDVAVALRAAGATVEEVSTTRAHLEDELAQLIEERAGSKGVSS